MAIDTERKGYGRRAERKSVSKGQRRKADKKAAEENDYTLYAAWCDEDIWLAIECMDKGGPCVCPPHPRSMRSY